VLVFHCASAIVVLTASGSLMSHSLLRRLRRAVAVVIVLSFLPFRLSCHAWLSMLEMGRF